MKFEKKLNKILIKALFTTLLAAFKFNLQFKI